MLRRLEGLRGEALHVLRMRRVNDTTTGAASTAGDCSTASGRATENADGDYFFCAASGAELAGIFRTAISALTNSIKLIKLP